MTSGFARKLRILGSGLLFVVPSFAFGQPEPRGNADGPVAPVEHATFHQLVFANDDIAVLNNLYPPGADSGFHAHYRDVFSVIIQPAPSTIQNVGQSPTEAPMVAAGTVGYGVIGATPRVHRVRNGGKGAYQIIVVEVRRARPSGNTISSRETAPQYVQILDNPRMRAWRLVLEPGDSVPNISQGGNGVRVVVRGGLLTTTTSGFPDQTLLLKAGDFAIQESGSTRALRNSGTDTVELVELELK